LDLCSSASSCLKELARDNDKIQKSLMADDTTSKLVVILEEPTKINHISLLYNVVALIWIIGQKKGPTKSITRIEFNNCARTIASQYSIRFIALFYHYSSLGDSEKEVEEIM